MSPILHPQAAKMRSLLHREGIRDLYHFTDIDNLPLIAQLGGLMSKEILENSGLLDQVKTGGNELSKGLDVHWGNWDKVSLSWCPKLPMAYWREQEQHLCYIVVRREVALQQGVVFTDRNATDNFQNRGEGIERLRDVNFSAVRQSYPYPSTDIKKCKQAEVLVPNRVLIADFVSIIFRSESSRQEAIRLCRRYPDIQPLFEVDARLFILPSAYTTRHWLTTQRDLIASYSSRNFSHQRIFREGTNLFLVTEIQAIYGTRERLVWLSGGNITERILASAGLMLSLHQIDCSNLSKGSYSIEYYLTAKQEIRQFQADFRLV